jgi:MobA-like NTP transferase protein
MTREDVTALILAGGKATRLGGVDKRAIVIDGRTIFERQVEALRPCVVEIIVSSPRAVDGYRTVVDAVADLGPLAGIAAGLAAAATREICPTCTARSSTWCCRARMPAPMPSASGSGDVRSRCARRCASRCGARS